ncbi:MAG: low molecular weight protein-tyrosine-phosphatase [Rothia sp. (in: high G+C Gram-positive bacteria)]|nr:low molecular weight protein-tyrosine-phosphatase [Rothia sp. (in: high G+C Gram-positive bacteria)]
MYKIMTVCTGNICRSPTGEFLLKDAAKKAGLEVEVTSSGISNEEEGNPIDRRAAKVLTELNINTSAHRAKQFTAADFESHDLLLAMDLNHYRALMRMASTDEQRNKVHLMREFDSAVADQEHDSLGIYDPWYGGQEDFYTTYEMIRDAVPGVIDFVKSHQ